MLLNVDDSRTALAIPPLLRLAFRPLFLGGVVFSILAIAWWTVFWVQPFQWQPYGGPIWWHGHEMLFGFGAAIVVGFLLTAVQTWTGVVGLRGRQLAVVAGTWLLGRVLIAFGSSLPGIVVMAGDALYLLLAAAYMAYPVVTVKQWHNLMFTPMLFFLALLNIASHWGVLTEQPELARQALHGAVMMIVLIVAVLAGRVVPFFTANTTGATRAPAIQWLETVSLGSIILLVIAAFIGFSVIPAPIMSVLFLVAALANGWRYSRWGFQHCGQTPLLWSLHLSYVFIPVGLLALALQSIGLIANFSAALHLLTVGGMAGMILAMISRVTLGHTGRPLEPPRLISVAYICIPLAALLRVLSGLIPGLGHWGMAGAGILWIVAFGIYSVYYVPMLVTTRADGRPG